MADAIGVRPTVCVFGRLRIQYPDGREIAPRGHTARALLLFVAFHGGAVSVEQAAEAVWPDLPLSVAKDRMKNNLCRLRTQCGTIIRRDGPLLTLDADTDLATFEHAAGLLLPFSGLTLAPDAYFAEWAASTRRRTDALRDLLADL